KPVLRTA
nr:Chain B, KPVLRTATVQGPSLDF peptide [synthetic construct]